MPEPESGIVCVYKPRGASSFAAASALRREFSFKKVGHAGTLDPLAEGLLILGFGRGTKALPSLQGLKKTYRAVFALGAESSTEDSEGDLSLQPSPRALAVRRLSYRSLEKAAEKFTGRISQVPSRFSAVHFEGKRAYDLARSGRDFELDPRPVEIYSFKIGRMRKLPGGGAEKTLGKPWRGEAALLECTVSCSKGTYIRALARDFGRELGCGAYLFYLQRSKIGPFSLKDCAPCRLEEGKVRINRTWALEKMMRLPSLQARLEENESLQG
ncbi:MAG: tRNA pseudouridine(55) synthase TruB [Aeriscardovia sp.]|nr:tRNA pseudouridine(55) synthase TruB [Aeriscardovia sp.]